MFYYRGSCLMVERKGLWEILQRDGVRSTIRIRIL